ncbi:MAG TPA: CaiB/BaiF CoA-transferase family protein [Candidatus Binataceae bacterium]|nr:CaiB/BaiF CoA-transferase family protein [Candidatus Binataceae bacterium]
MSHAAERVIALRPLEGIRVLDLSRVLAGPFCTMNLADLGAEVIKVEMPGRGDDSRGYAPRIPNSNDSGYFYSVNRGKSSVTLDLRQPAGAEILLALAQHADIVVENFSPGTMERFGLGYARLHAANPRIILCSISGFGQSGPMAAAPAYDIVAQALGGTMSITGDAGGAPMRCGVSVGDLAAALYAVVAIFAALRVRDSIGVGQHLDIAMLDCQVAWLEDALARYSATGRVPGPVGSRHPSITPFQQFRAADDYFVAGCGNEAIWGRFCDAIGLSELRLDPRFALNADRTAHHVELEPILADHFARHPRAHWLARLEAASVPCAPIANVAEVTRNPHLAERQMILHADHPSFPDLIVPGSPLKVVGVDSAPNTRSPQLGEHTDQVLARLLGYDASRLAELRTQQII